LFDRVRAGSLGVTADAEELVGIAFDAEVKAPGTGYSTLPDIACFIIFLGVK